MLQYCSYRIAELQTIIDWLQHRFQILLQSDDTVEQFTRAGESEPLDLDNDQGKRVAKLMDRGNFEEIAKYPGSQP